jgi:hypothetical protein
MKTCSVLKQRGCATRELYGNRRVDSRKRDKEQMRPFGTGPELCRHGVSSLTRSMGDAPSVTQVFILFFTVYGVLWGHRTTLRSRGQTFGGGCHSLAFHTML